MDGRFRWLVFVVCLGITASAPSAVSQPVVDHALWDQLLKRHVKQGRVDYQGFQADREALERYLALVKLVDPNGLHSVRTQLVFWINVYNACVVKGVLDHAPLRSVKDVRGFFDQFKYEVAGESLTLNEIERKGRACGDFRIHFALVCASSSCPPLRSEAYAPERVDAQLDEQGRLFLRDPIRGARLEGHTVWLSQIFKWYKRDFANSKLSAALISDEKILSAIEPYLDAPLQAAIHGKPLLIRFMDYDWSLNRIR